jgi:glycosyltransferase involved in cell wall biosynthesis
MTKYPLVSAVMTVFNGERHLHAAIISALKQSYRNIELVIVDDGSTDSSIQILQSFGERIRLVLQENHGVSHARNLAISISQGDYIAFIDQDDIWMLNKIERQIGLFINNPSLGLIHTYTGFYDDINKNYVVPFSIQRTATLSGDCYEQLLEGNGLANSSVMVSRNALNKVGLFDLALTKNTAQDYDLWLRIAQIFPFGYISDLLTVYRLHPSQGMWNIREMQMAELVILDKHLRILPVEKRKKLRNRISQLLVNLGIRHLDAKDFSAARRSFARSFRLKPAHRSIVLLILTLLGDRAVECVWKAKNRFSRSTEGNWIDTLSRKASPAESAGISLRIRDIKKGCGSRRK